MTEATEVRNDEAPRLDDVVFRSPEKGEVPALKGLLARVEENLPGEVSEAHEPTALLVDEVSVEDGPVSVNLVRNTDPGVAVDTFHVTRRDDAEIVDYGSPEIVMVKTDEDDEEVPDFAGKGAGMLAGAIELARGGDYDGATIVQRASRQYPYGAEGRESFHAAEGTFLVTQTEVCHPDGRDDREIQLRLVRTYGLHSVVQIMRVKVARGQAERLGSTLYTLEEDQEGEDVLLPDAMAPEMIQYTSDIPFDRALTVEEWTRLIDEPLEEGDMLRPAAN